VSRALGRKTRLKQLYAEVRPDAQGREMFKRGEPCPPGKNDKGTQHARWRGWMRAAAEARTKGKA
jgi:hypothetical protein